MSEEYLKGLTKEELINIIDEETSCTYQLKEDKELLKRENKQLKEIEKEHQKINGELREENKKLKEVIEEVREVINGHIQNEYAMCKAFDEIEFILDKVKENK